MILSGKYDSGIQAIRRENLVDLSKDMVNRLQIKSHHSKINSVVDLIKVISRTFICEKDTFDIKDDKGYTNVGVSLCNDWNNDWYGILVNKKVKFQTDRAGGD